MQAAVIALAVFRLALRLTTGPEYDSNANRVEQSAHPVDGAAAPVGSFLLRAAAHGRLSLAAGPWAMRLRVDVGGKLFFAQAARPQDMAVVRARLDGARRFDGGSTLALHADYLDSFQWNPCPLQLADNQFVEDTSCHRDLRTGGARLDAELGDPLRLGHGALSFRVDAGARRYEWKPDPDLSFVGVGGGLGPVLRLRSVVEPRAPDDPPDEQAFTLSLTGRVEWRLFDGPALEYVGDLGDASEPRRADLVVSGLAALGYDGPVLASAGFLVETSRSNGAGASYTYEALTLRLAVPLPARMTLATRVQLLFFAAGAIPGSLAADEENRDGLLVDLSRDMGAGFTLVARYSGYTSAIGALGQNGDAGDHYARHLVYLGVSYRR